MNLSAPRKPRPTAQIWGRHFPAATPEPFSSGRARPGQGLALGMLLGLSIWVALGLLVWWLA